MELGDRAREQKDVISHRILHTVGTRKWVNGDIDNDMSLLRNVWIDTDVNGTLSAAKLDRCPITATPGPGP